MPRTPKAPPAPIRLRCDHRETDIIALLRRDPGVEVEETVFEIGDFELIPGMFVERKTSADMTASILDRRLFDQVERAKATGTKLVFLVEGDPFKIGRIHPNALIGAQSYVSVIEGFPIVQVPTSGMTCEFLKRAAKHAREGLGYEISMRGATPKSIEMQQLFVLESLPGIGRDRARVLLSHFGSLRAVLSATPAQIQAVDGFGDALADGLQALLDAPYVPVPKVAGSS